MKYRHSVTLGNTWTCFTWCENKWYLIRLAIGASFSIIKTVVLFMPDFPVGIYTFQRLKILNPEMEEGRKTFQQHMNRKDSAKRNVFLYF
jgi:hypothetical protein